MKKVPVALTALSLVMAGAIAMAQQPPAAGARPQTPPATGPLLDLANSLVEAINKQDTSALQKMLAPDAVYLDEDGHAPPARVWINKLTNGTPAKQVVISSTHGQTWDDAGWVSFNYSLTETLQG